jgi:hypothetical protein
MKKLLLLLLAIPSINAMELIPANNVSSANHALKLYTNHKHMYVEDEDASYRVERHNMNKEMRDVLAFKAITKFKDAGYIRIDKNSDGKYTLAAKVRGEGGGPGGATVGCYLGKFIVHFVAHGTITVVSMMSGPAAPATAAALEATFLPAIEAASNVGAIAGGIIGGVVTGPA